MSEEFEKAKVNILNSANRHDYVFTGRIYPERVQDTKVYQKQAIGTDTYCGHFIMVVFINSRQVIITLVTEKPSNEFDLRNLCADMVGSMLAAETFLTGISFSLEITTVFCGKSGLYRVFGADNPVLSQRNKTIEVEADEIFEFMSGENGFLVRSCFDDLNMALTHIKSLPFYCYRAIESLRQHYNAVSGNNFADDSKGRTKQWEAFRNFTGIQREAINPLSDKSKFIRHGNPVPFTGEEADLLLELSWIIVEQYILKSGVGRVAPPKVVPGSVGTT